MASVKVKFRASSVADREGRLFYQIIHNRVTRQISSGHKLFPSEWEVLQRNILPPNCEGPRHAYLVALKSRIADDKARLERIISRLEHTGESYTAGDVAARYLTPPDAGGFLSFARSLAGQLRQIGKIRKSKLLRPLRVCGMVKNVGEPGGGPFLAVNPDGTVSLQVLESSQIDMSDPAKKAMFEKGTHFNPVDLVCAVKNHKGEKYNLPDYVDKNTGFISYKSKDGRELKALELPGLWNGAMSDWNTVFVEVPIETFNPVKTVNDLLRPEHQ